MKEKNSYDVSICQTNLYTRDQDRFDSLLKTQKAALNYLIDYLTDKSTFSPTLTAACHNPLWVGLTSIDHPCFPSGDTI